MVLRFPRYVYLVRERHCEEGEMIVDVLMKEGQATASHIIITSCLKMIEHGEEGGSGSALGDRHVTLKNLLLQLVEEQFIQRCPNPQDATKAVPVMTIKEELLYSLPTELIDLKAIQKEVLHRQSSGCPGVTNFPDKDVFWRLNFDRFHLELRDSEIRNSIVRRVDPLAGECLGAVLKVSYTRSDPWAPTMNVVTASEIRDQLKNLKNLDMYLKILEEESGGCLQRFGDAGGGQYYVNMAAAYQTLTHNLLDNIVQERFGSKAARIFRLIREQKMMEQEQIGELSMIDKKEANMLVYKLLHDNFLHIHELRRTLTPSPANKNSYLFHVDMNLCVRMVLEWCYKALYNLMVQRETRHNENKRLLEKKTRVDTIVENLKQSGASEEQIQEVEEMVTPSEKELVQHVIATEDKLFHTETGLDETLLILHMYLYYQPQKV
ncbi:RNA polymerase III subunit C isoform X2 [Oratosquilla oratoria]